MPVSKVVVMVGVGMSAIGALAFWAIRRHLGSRSKPLPPLDTMEQKGPEGRRVQEIPPLGSGLIFFGNRLCPFSHRAWIAAHEKGIADKMDYIHIDLGKRKPAWFKQVNEFATVPCLYEDGKGIFESLIVAEYLEDRFPDSGNSILPHDPHQRFAIRLFLEKAVRPLLEALYPLLQNQDPSQFEAKKKAVEDALQYMNKLLVSQSNGPFFLGEDFTLADIAILPFLDRFSVVLKFYRGVDIFSIPKTERVKLLFQAAKARPSFQKTAQSEQDYRDVYYHYAHPV